MEKNKYAKTIAKIEEALQEGKLGVKDAVAILIYVLSAIIVSNKDQQTTTLDDLLKSIESSLRVSIKSLEKLIEGYDGDA